MSPTELYFLKQFFAYNSQGQEEKKKGQVGGKKKKESQPMENSRIVCYANDGKAKTVQLGTAAQRAPSEGLGSHSRCLLVPAAVFLSWGPAASSSLSFSSSPGHLRRWSVLWPNNNNNNQRACERTHRRKPINPGPKPSDSYRLMESRAEERVVFPHLLQDCFLLPAASPDWWLYVLEQPVAWNL